MKHILFIAVVFLNCLNLVAQEITFQEDETILKKEPKYRNTVTTGLTSLLWSNFSVSYERTFKSNKSFKIRLNASPGTTIPFFAVSENVLFEDAEMSGFGFTPELRFFVRKKDLAPDGLYIALHAKFNRWNITDEPFEFRDVGGFRGDMSGDGFIQRVGAGVTIGRQWILGERFVLDFWFLGFDMNQVTTDITISSSDSFPIDEAERFAEEENMEVSRNGNTLNAKSSGFGSWFRFGLALGVAF